jgi:tetratricopeptide (TPR) repeat protein
MAALSAATAAREAGRLRRAETIIAHALALAPRHPDILIEYGMLMETGQKNIIEAETFYTRALAINPSHELALRCRPTVETQCNRLCSHRRRTQPLVEELDARMMAAIDKKREFFLQIPRGNAALRRAMRESYFEHVYNTVALEGSTMTLAQTR